MNDLKIAIDEVRAHASQFLQTVELSTIQALLPDEHTVVVTFCLTEQGSMAFIISKYAQDIQIVEVPTFTQTDLHRLIVEWDADDRAVGGWIGTYRRYRIEPNSSNFSLWQTMITETLAILGRDLLMPIISAIPISVERLVLLPSTDLFLLPLHAVPLPDHVPERMCDRYQISYAPSLEVLVETYYAKIKREVTPELYAVINPTTDLVLALVEGAVVSQLCTECHIDEGLGGTKEHVLAGVSGRSYVHFACRGSYDWENPSASGLYLADSCLTLTELQNGVVDLTSARLVTLSACETGIVDVIKGNAEEYVGIPAGFLLAGVPCVVSSLWVVPDLCTTLLMEQFYRNHLTNGMDLADALRKAQKWLRELSIGGVVQYAERWQKLRSRRKEKVALYECMRHYRYEAKRDPTLRPFAHPYYWAAFTCTGV